MIISHKHRFIFIKTRKTAGTSMEIALARHCGPDDIITSISQSDEAYRSQLGYPGRQNTRIPLSVQAIRGQSLRSLIRRRGRLAGHSSAGQVRAAVGPEVWDSYFKFTIERNPFDKAVSRYWWSTRNRAPRPSIEEFFALAPVDKFSDWRLYSAGNEILVDHIARYERLEDEIALLSTRLGIELELPPVRAKGGHRIDRRPYTEVLSPLVRSRIEMVCWRELAAFGYSWNDALSS